jgi:predicted aldo/keto reductase-like oxidoreductase
MDFVKLNHFDIELSPLGMGTAPMVTRVHGKKRVELVREVYDLGVNWFDTARGYGDSEIVLGEALQDIRGKVVVITKSTAQEPDLLATQIDESLERLKTDYVDVFLFHGGGAIKSKAFYGDGGLLETATKAKKAGKIRYLGFSAHSEALACDAVDIEELEFAMVPANFISTKYIDGEFMRTAKDRGMPVIAMKPFGGGRIQQADLCLRFLKQYSGLLPCVGVDRIDHMRDNLRYWEEAAEISKDDRDEIERIRDELGDRFCRQCGYCQPCPEDVPIIMMNLMEAWVKQFSAERLATSFGNGVETARGCTECRECVEKCPYDLPIPEMIKDGIALFEKTTSGVKS